MDWIMSSEVKWSHVTLKCIKRSMHIFVVQLEKAFGVPPTLPMVQKPGGEEEVTHCSISPFSFKHQIRTQLS